MKKVTGFKSKSKKESEDYSPLLSGIDYYRRKEDRPTNYELATICHLSYPSYMSRLRNPKAFRLDELTRLANRLQTTVNNLLTFAPQDKEKP